MLTALLSRAARVPYSAHTRRWLCATAGAASPLPLPPNLTLDRHATRLLLDFDRRIISGVGAGEPATAPMPLTLPVYSASTSGLSLTDVGVAGASAGVSAGDATLNPQVWHLPSRGDIVHRAIVWSRACARRTLYKARDRAEVAGGGRKPWRQKGTGRARAGSTRSPLWRGGGVAHGPVFRDWSLALPKRMRAQALRTALSSKLRDGRVLIVDALPPALIAEPSKGDGMTAAKVVKTRAVKAWVAGIYDGTLGYMRKGAAAAAAAAAAASGEAPSTAQLVRHAKQNAQPACVIVDTAIAPALRKGAANLARVRTLPVHGLSVRDVVWAHTIVLTRAALAATNSTLAPDMDRRRSADSLREAVEAVSA